MVFKEEFEYLSFKCCYCGFFNPSRKKRPSGPKFEPKLSPSRTVTTHSSDSEDSSGDSDCSSKPVITEITSDIVGDTNDRKISISEVENDTSSQKEINSITTANGDSGFSHAGLQESGESQTDTAYEQSYNANLNPFEDGNPSGEDCARESHGGDTPMDYETIDGSEVVGTQDSDLIDRQETKED